MRPCKRLFWPSKHSGAEIHEGTQVHDNIHKLLAGRWPLQGDRVTRGRETLKVIQVRNNVLNLLDKNKADIAERKLEDLKAMCYYPRNWWLWLRRN